MGEITNTTEKAPKKSWAKGIKAEFNKIVWSDKNTLAKQSFAVIIVTIVLGVIIHFLDIAVRSGLDILIG